MAKQLAAATTAAAPPPLEEPKETPQEFAARYVAKKKAEEAARRAEAATKRRARAAARPTRNDDDGSDAAEDEGNDGETEEPEYTASRERREPRAAPKVRAPPPPAFDLEEVTGAPTLHSAHGSSPRVSAEAKAKLAAVAGKKSSSPRDWGAGASPRDSKPRAPAGGTMLKCSDEVVPLTKVQAQVLKEMGLKDATKTTGATVKTALSSPRAMALAKEIIKADAE